ncbi:MAG: ral nucleoside transport system permease protein [Chloroflexota bacterium]|nr:ral nucleoside transport system permease protein [Chloroflexota bacterium]
MSSAQPVAGRRRPNRSVARAWSAIAIPLTVVVLSVLLGAVIILVSELLVPGKPFDWGLPLVAYGALVEGSIGSADAVVSTLVNSTPLVFGGLAVGFGFKAGLFNIGAQGQFLVGALGAVIVGVWLRDSPPPVAIPFAMLAGFVAGGLWGFVPGFLKAVSGAHEVVSTIMMNYIAVQLLAALVSGPLKVPKSPSPVTFSVGNASFPIILGRNGHLGILLALLAAIFVWWLLFRTTWGFQVRSVGANPDASRYAGMRPRLITVATMTFSGALAGLAGTSVLLGVTHTMTSGFGTTVGFDSIAVALLARSHPLVTLLAALLFGAMRAGAGLMQIRAQIPVELVDVLQAVILLFLVASPVLRHVLRAIAPAADPGPPAETPELTPGVAI